MLSGAFCFTKFQNEEASPKSITKFHLLKCERRLFKQKSVKSLKCKVKGSRNIEIKQKVNRREFSK